MTPDSIILLSPDNRLEHSSLSERERLDALINALQCARTRFKLSGYGLEWVESLDAYTAAWEALHAELMNQLPNSES